MSLLIFKKKPADAPATLSDEEITRGYRLIFGREPEQGAYAVHRVQPDYDSFLASLLRSEEFQKKPSLQHRWHAWYQGVDPKATLARHLNAHRQAVPGSIVNFLGVTTELAYVAWAKEGVEGLPVPGNFHATEAEWVACMRAVDLARDHFTVVELGAGWGCWTVNTAVAAKRLGMRVTAIGIEGDEGHVRYMQQHRQANGLSDSEFTADTCVIGVTGGGAAFPVYGDAASAYGQEPKFFDTEVELERFIAQAEHPHRKVPAKTLAEAFTGHARIDLLHIDIQGGEETLLRNNLPIINEKVAYLFVGTHGRDLEGQIMAMMLQEGWKLEVEEPCSLPQPLRGGISYVDGAQGWRNPRLT